MPPRKLKKAKPENVVWRNDNAPSSTGSDALKNFDGGSLFESDVVSADTGASATHVLRKEDCEFSAKSAAILASLEARARKEEAEKALKAHNDIILAAAGGAAVSAAVKDDVSSHVSNGLATQQPRSPRNSLDNNSTESTSVLRTAKETGQSVANDGAASLISNSVSSSSSSSSSSGIRESVSATFQYKGASFGSKAAHVVYSSAVSAPLPCHPLNSWFLSEGVPNFSQKSVRGKRLYEHEVDEGALRSLKRVRDEAGVTVATDSGGLAVVAGSSSAATVVMVGDAFNGVSSFDIDIEWGADAAHQSGVAAEGDLLRSVQQERELERSLLKQLHDALG